MRSWFITAYCNKNESKESTLGARRRGDNDTIFPQAEELVDYYSQEPLTFIGTLLFGARHNSRQQ
jgi:hypothetical protein